MATVSDQIIAVCWFVFIVYWIISAVKLKAVAERQSLLSAAAHRIPIGLCWFLLIVRNLPPPFGLPLTPRTNEMHIIGAAICVAGLFVTVWARWTLAGNWSSDVTFKQNHELIKAGPYRFVRHPIYTGLLLMCLGTALDIGQLRGWIGLIFLFIGFWIKLKQEEKLMLQHFPEQYPAYRKQVKALVPFVI